MTIYGDFSSGRPSAAALRANGFSGVICYVGVGSSGKRLTASEYAGYRAGGIDVLCVFELSTSDVSGGHAGGVSKAQAALNDMRALGVPDSTPCFAACDSHVNSAAGVTVANAKAYAQGAVSVLGKPRTGYYGFDDTLGPVHAAGIVTYYWLCGSRPDATEQGYVDFWQDNTSSGVITVEGTPVDVDRVYTFDPNNPEEDMAITDADATLVANKILNSPDFYNLAHRMYGAVNNTGVSALQDGTQEPNYLGRVNAMVSSVGTKIDAITATEATVLADVLAGDTGIQSIFGDTESIKTILAGIPAAVANTVQQSGVLDPTAVATALAPILAPLVAGGGLTAEQIGDAVAAALHGATFSGTVS